MPLAIDDVTWFKSNFKLVAWLICVGSACQQLKYLHLRKKKVACDPRDPLLIQFLGAVLPLTQSSFI